MRSIRSEDACTLSKLPPAISEVGRAIHSTNSTPPSSSDWKTSVPARNMTERYPKTSTSLSIMGLGHREGDLAAADVAVGGEHLPLQFIGAGLQAASLRLQNVGIRLLGKRKSLL